MGLCKYLGSCAWLAIRHSLGKTDSITFIIIIIVGALSWLSKSLPAGKDYPRAVEFVMQLDEWQIATAVLAIIILIRLGLAPYWLYKDKIAEVAKINLEKGKLAERLKQKERNNFSLNWENYSWKLRLEGWDAPIWEDESQGHSLLLEGWIGISVFDPIRIESIAINLAGGKYNCVWESTEFFISEEHDIACDIPLNTPRGKQTAYLTAIVNGKPYESKSFTLDLPKGKQAPDKEGFQT